MSAAQVARGGAITGKLGYSGPQPPRLLRVRLIEETRGTAEGVSTTIEHSLGEGGTSAPPPDGTPVPFAIPVPPTAPLSFNGRILHLHHLVEAEADLALRENPRMGVQVRIV